MQPTIKETHSTPKQRKFIFKLCNFDHEIKEATVNGFTNGRTTSLRELSQREADELIRKLDVNYAYFDHGNTQHRYIMSLLHQLNWVRQKMNGEKVPNIERLNTWLKSKRSPVRKPLKQMSKQELTKIISALESILNKQV